MFNLIKIRSVVNSTCVLLLMSVSSVYAGSDAAVAEAEAALAQAKELGAEWRLIDSATGSKAGSLSKLLAVAKEKASNGENDEVIRIANKVTVAAMLGIDQAKAQASASPTY
jgi:hypothetical protein